MRLVFIFKLGHLSRIQKPLTTKEDRPIDRVEQYLVLVSI